ncbi:MAG: UDP-N-acetylglucosamine--N-acetylmuramyl-(pentapeptide) pyrophosphoryl-undecaprenol N-acetylglucosamine transferase [Xanthomonadales bacterium]|jgi:UDP-N-acetylglucosamine--N-acetylmuramyl-(pentapeptide) pyrophosphoryl-undecaprenol N-acetylglucosamine transferase|nr:UDP-N-acetylglucosamine--N-acetylmuramyl-(pentapeptide) pyrophosphoryl-undecaprenol N-acetylglucosamine transferase [Xanthomonadales bacterium]
MNRAGQGVLIMAGGTGGHIYPGLAVADSLRAAGIPVRWLGARGGMECDKVPGADIELDVVDISGLRGKGVASWLTMPLKLLRAVYQAFRVLGEHRPCCAISFGGYAAGPGGLAARLRGIPLVVHEQNRVPGMTNRSLARFASKVLQAFPGSWEEKQQAITVGNPVRRAVVELDAPEKRLAGRQGPVRILLTGGSQGALALNRLLPGALGLLAGSHEFEVRHQAGPRWVEETRAAYAAAGIPCGSGFSREAERADGARSVIPEGLIAAEAAPTRWAEVTDFIEDMASAYAWADVVVCRAGALTVSEIAAAGVAALFIPFPHAVDDHQTRNAEFLVESEAALLLQESHTDARKLANVLSPLVGDRARLASMAMRGRAVAVPDSADRVAALCREYIDS